MEYLYGVLSSISRDLVCGAVNQLRYPCCFNNFVEELAKEEGNLIATRNGVKDRIVHAEQQTRRTAEVMHKWLEKAEIDVDNVNTLLTEARTKNSCCFGHCPNWIFRYRLGKKLANKKEELEKFIKEGRPYVQLERVATLPPDSSSDKYLSFGSRKKADEELMEAVKDDEIGMIGLYGMGGCGKTTMAEKIKKIAEAEHLFDKVIFVPVSSTVQVGRIQDKIASSLQYTFPENEERERARRLCTRLTQENKILVILDDVWQKLDFDSIGIPSTEHHKGCKVLITTRSEDVCNSMDCKTIQLPILEDEEAWTLFQKEANINEGTSDTIKHLARQISNECKGLPVAIAAVASTLKCKDEDTWKVALSRLKISKRVHIEKGLQDPYKCLELSYHYLDHEEAKSLFLLCSVFPEDYEIPIELLTRCAIGLGVVGEVRSYEEARSEVNAAKNKLVSSCLLMLVAVDDIGECVKMHDLVRDVAHLIAKNEKKLIKCEVENDVTLEQNSVRYLWCKKLPNDLDCSNLEFLCITTKVEVLDEIFTRMRQLRVLFLDNRGDRLPLSTMSFKTLTNLRCLILTYWKLSDISFVRDMKKLESLSLNECSLPSFIDLQKDDVVTQLTKLKLLVLYHCKLKSNIFEVIGRIPRLEELCIIDDSENAVEFFKSFSVPQILQRYTIMLAYGYYTGEYFVPPERIILLSYFHISNEAIVCLAKKAKILSIRNIEGGAKNIIPDIFQLEEGGMSELSKLSISDSKEIECLVDTSNHMSEVVGILFSNLLDLSIKRMEDLRVLWHGCLPPSGAFRKLESLSLCSCPQLTSLFTQAITPNPVRYTIFQNLQEVIVSYCGELKYVFSANIVGGLPQLKTLEISGCGKLDQIIELNQMEIIPENTSTPSAPLVNHSSGSFTMSKLTSIKLQRCPKLGSLFPASTAKTLISLENLIIEECHGLKHLLTCERAHNNKKQDSVEDDHDLQSVISIFLSLKSLHIEACDLLQHIFCVFFVGGQNDFEDNSCHLQHKNIQIGRQASSMLEELKLYDLPQMTCIWVASKNYFNLQYLQTLKITRCAKLEVIFPVSVVRCLPELECLEIEECKELKQIMEEDVEDKKLSNIVSPQPCFPKLNTLIIETCAKMEVIFPVSVVRYLPELERLEIIECRELKQIMEEDVEDKKLSNIVSPQPCFPKLKEVHVSKCHKLKRLFSTCTSNDLPNLEFLIIDEAAELEELIGFEQGASKNYFNLQYLKTLQITRCANLEVIFPVSVVGCLPELERQEIEECKELKQIMEEDVEDKKLSNIVSPQPCFPKLKEVHVRQYHKLKCLFSTSTSNDLPNLEVLAELEEFMGFEQGASKNYFNLQYLKTLQIWRCAKLEVIFPVSVVRCLPELEFLCIIECKELKQIMEEDVEDKKLSNIVSPQPCFLKLKKVIVRQCHKLEVIFPVSVVRCLPELEHLDIEECNELKKIMEEEDENDTIQIELKPCFPKLTILSVQQCHKLKHLFSMSASNGLLNLEVLIINGANELEELIGCEQRNDEGLGKSKVELPKLKLVIFMHLSNLCQGIELRAVKHCIINNCPKLSLTSTTTPQEVVQSIRDSDFENLGNDLFWQLKSWIREITESNELSKRSGTSELPSSQINEELEKEFIEKVHGSEVHDTTATSKNLELDERSSPSPLDIHQCETNIEELVNGQSMSGSYLKDQQKPLGETESTIAIPQNIKIGVKEGTTSENATMVSSHLESTSSQLDSSEHKSYELDSKPENTSTLLNQEDPSTSKSKSPFSHVNDDNQSMPGSIAEMVREHKQIHNEAPVSETGEFLELERERERTSHLQSLERKLPPISSLNMTELVDAKSSNEAGFPDQHALRETMNFEEIRKESIQEGSASEGAIVKTLSAGVESISLGSGVATLSESSEEDILTQHSQVINQDDKLNESKKIIQIQEESNLMDKKKGISMVSDNSIEVTPDTHTRLEAYKHFVDLDNVQVAILVEAITIYPHLWNACEKFSERFQAWMLKTLADMLLFLRNESVVSVTPRRENEFHKLCDEAVQLGFERSWVDEMRQRVVARDPELDHAQARISELLKRHDHLTQELRNIQNELKRLNDFVDAQTKCFDFL